jgi:hypothetical protein
MLIQVGNYQINTQAIKLKGRSQVRVNGFNIRTSLVLKPGDNIVDFVVPNSTGRLFIKLQNEEKKYPLLKNEPADLFLNGDELSLGTKDTDEKIKITSDVEIVFKSGLDKVVNPSDYNFKKILKLAKTPKTRYEIFQSILSADQYHAFIYGHPRNRSALYGQNLWPLVDAGLLRPVDKTHRRYANLFQTV